MLPRENRRYFYQAQAASHEGVTKADVVVEDVALQDQCRWSEYIEVVEDLETDAFFSVYLTEYQMTKVQKQMFSSKNNGEQLKFSKGGQAPLSWA